MHGRTGLDDVAAARGEASDLVRNSRDWSRRLNSPPVRLARASMCILVACLMVIVVPEVRGSGGLGSTVAAPATSAPITDFHESIKVGPQIPVSWSLPGQNGEVEQAVDPVTHYLYTVWMGGPIAGRIAFSRSTDGGASFGPAITVPGSAEFNNATVSTQSLDPSIVTSSNGTIFVAFIHFNFTTAPLWWVSPVLAVSYDHGKSFAFSKLVHKIWTSNGAIDRDFLGVAPNGDLYMTWSYVPNGTGCGGGGTIGCQLNLQFARSTDGGHHWSSPVFLGPGYPYAGTDIAPLVVESSGAIDILYTQSHSRPHQPGNFSYAQDFFIRSTNFGATWSKPVEVGNPADRISSSTWWIDACLAVGPKGVIYATYDSQLPSQDIGWLLCSTDHGKTWSHPIRITTSSTGAIHIIQVAVGPDGTAYVGWITNDSSRGWSGYISTYSIAEKELFGPVRVNTYYDLPLVWPGDTIGLVALGHDRAAMAWGIGNYFHGFYSNNIFNVVVQFTDE
jgi:BNR/Asp-box repeat